MILWATGAQRTWLKHAAREYRGFAASTVATALVVAAVLLAGIPQEAQDRVFATTHRDLDSANNTRPIDQIVVFGHAGSETRNELRARLCGGSLWIDHIAEALGADLVSHAHGYAVRTRTISARGRTERVVAPLGDGAVQPLAAQLREVVEAAAAAADVRRTLHVLVADPAHAAGNRTAQVAALAAAANELVLQSGVRRVLVVDAPTARRLRGLSMELAAALISDPAVDVAVYDSVGFLERMQREYYKYGLRFPDRPCVHSQRRWCTKPDRFFWCDASHVGSKAHFYMADDIVKKHFMDSVAPRLG
ncbi:hypothetical protein IWQ56_000076 [Coemansia nantahalensis]|uniref:Uncharacterized protein n=2 Tax=Coemansia TaxID=4863 RepID=A0ACC1L8S6_9FUNG|nr:hypothetical protein IWQ57_001600 [Coemansia nantahalensis]KAJ2775373.1 hypothetical protein IWQ56_000076 [Coemansia nantahalensis]KAJ2803099.1 hypothetical protein H4R21_002163 [Coemansia helicoidea]